MLRARILFRLARLIEGLGGGGGTPWFLSSLQEACEKQNHRENPSSLMESHKQTSYYDVMISCEQTHFQIEATQFFVVHGLGRFHTFIVSQNDVDQAILHQCQEHKPSTKPLNLRWYMRRDATSLSTVVVYFFVWNSVGFSKKTPSTSS